MTSDRVGHLMSREGIFFFIMIMLVTGVGYYYLTAPRNVTSAGNSTSTIQSTTKR